MFSRLKNWWLSLDTRWPDAKPLPKHVQDVRLDPHLLLLHMSSAVRPTDRTVTGYTKPSLDKKDKAA